MNPWVRWGLPAVAVVAILPVIAAPTGGPHGSLYSMVVFVLSLPALVIVGVLRDADLVQSAAAETVVVVMAQFVSYFLLVSLVGWCVSAVRRHPRRPT